MIKLVFAIGKLKLIVHKYLHVQRFSFQHRFRLFRVLYRPFLQLQLTMVQDFCFQLFPANSLPLQVLLHILCSHDTDDVPFPGIGKPVCAQDTAKDLVPACILYVYANLSFYIGAY